MVSVDDLEIRSSIVAVYETFKNLVTRLNYTYYEGHENNQGWLRC